MTDGRPCGEPAGILEEQTRRVTKMVESRKLTVFPIAIGNDADVSVLSTFTGNAELVFRVHNIEALKTVIKVAVVTSSMVSSQSSSVCCSSTVPGTTEGASTGSTPAPTKAQLTADAISEELQGEMGIDVGDDALMDELDIDEFD